jgi:hypothetical protein
MASTIQLRAKGSVAITPSPVKISRRPRYKGLRV